MIRFLKDNDGFYLIVGLRCFSLFWETPELNDRIPKWFGGLMYGRTASAGYRGFRAEFWFCRLYFLADIDHYEDFEAMQSYFNIPLK